MAPRVRGCRWSAIPAADATCSDPDNGKSGMVGVLNKEPKEENLKKGKRNTPGTRGWSRLRNRMLAVQKKRTKISFFFVKKKITLKKYIFLDIPSSYAKILGETNF